MNFELYVPAITSYLDPSTDSICKGWDELVTIFFELNNDPTMAEHTDFALAFDNTSFPNYLRVEVGSIDKYFDSFKISNKTLIEENFIENKDFIKDNQSTRISFNTLRTLVFIKGTRELMEVYRLIDNIYQIYQRYKVEMMSRSKNPTCWVLVERISAFTSQMSPQTDPKNPIMKDQPKVYIIAKGSYKSITARLKKNKTDHEKLDDPKYSIEPSTPIYQSMTSNIEDELHAVLNFLTEQRLVPYKQEKDEQHMKLSKSHILIDPSQKQCSIETIKEDIQYVRNCIQLGIKTHSQKQAVKKYLKKTKINPNVVDIEIFKQSNGEHIDEQKLIPLSKPWIDTDIAVLTTKISDIKIHTPNTEICISDQENDDMEVDDQQTIFDDDKSEVESIKPLPIAEKPKRTTKPVSTKAPTRAPTSAATKRPRVNA